MQHLYEILFRFNEEGRAQGAHAQYRKVIKDDDGAVVAERLSDAIPLSLVDVKDKPTVAGVIGEAALAFVTAKEEAEARAASLEAECEARDATAQTLLESKAEVEGKLAEAEAALARAHAKVAELLPLAQLTDPSLTA